MAGRKAGSKSAGYHSNLSIPGYQPKTPTKAPPPSEAATSPAGDYPGAQKQYERSVAALPPAAQAVTESATQAAEHAERAALRAQRAEARQQRVINKYVTKAFEKPKQPDQKPSSPFSLPSVTQDIEHAKVDVAKVRESLLTHPQVKQANAEGKVVGLKGLRQIRQSTAEANALKPAHGLTHSKKYGVGAAGISQTPAQLRHLEAIQGVPQGTQGRRMATIMEKKHEESEPSTLEDLSYASIGIPGIGVGGDLAKLSELGLKAIPEIASREGASALATKAGAKAAESAASAAAKTKALPAEILRGAKGLPSFAKESPQLARAGAKALPGAAKAAAKGAPAAIGRGALRGAENTYQVGGGLSAVAATQKAGIHTKPGEVASAILRGGEQAVVHHPVETAETTLRALPAAITAPAALAYGAAQIPFSGTKPLEQTAKGQLQGLEQIGGDLLSGDPKRAQKAIQKEGALTFLTPVPALSKTKLWEAPRDAAREVAASTRRATGKGRIAPADVTQSLLGYSDRNAARKRVQLAHSRASNPHRVSEAKHTNAILHGTLRRPSLSSAPEGSHVALQTLLEYGIRSPEGVKLLRDKGPKTEPHVEGKVNLDAALRYAEEHPEIFKDKHFARALKAGERASKTTPAALLEMGEVARHRAQGDLFGITPPDKAVPFKARDLTKATDREGAWKDVAKGESAAKKLRKEAETRRAQAKVLEGPKADKLRAEAKALGRKAKAEEGRVSGLKKALDKYSRPDQKSISGDRLAWDKQLEKEYVAKVQEAQKTSPLVEPVWTHHGTFRSSKLGIEGGSLPGKAGGKVYVRKGSLAQSDLVDRSLEAFIRGTVQMPRRRAAATEFARHFVREEKLPYTLGGKSQHIVPDSETWAKITGPKTKENPEGGQFDPKTYARFPLREWKSAVEHPFTTESDLKGILREAEAGRIADHEPSVIVPRESIREFQSIANPDHSPVTEFANKLSRTSSRLILGTNPAWLIAQIPAEGIPLALAHPELLNPFKTGSILKDLHAYAQKHPEQAAALEGAAGASPQITAGTLRSPLDLEKEGAFNPQPAMFADAAKQLTRGRFGRAMVSSAKLEPLGLFDVKRQNAYRSVLMAAEADKRFRSFESSVRGMFRRSSQLSERFRGKSREELWNWLSTTKEGKQQLSKLADYVDNIQGNWTSFTRYERAFAPFAIFYPFLRYSLRWTLWTFPRTHPVTATIAYMLGQANSNDLEKVLGGKPSSPIQWAYPVVRDANGKPSVLPGGSRISPGQSVIQQAIAGQSLGQLAGGLNPFLGAGITALGGPGPFGTKPSNPAGWAAVDQLLAMPAPLRLLHVHSEDIAAKLGIGRPQPQSVISKAFEKLDPSKPTRQALAPWLPQSAGDARMSSQLSKALGEASANSSEKQKEVAADDSLTVKARQQKIAQMKARSEKASATIEGVLKKLGLDKEDKASYERYKASLYEGEKKAGGYSSSGYEGTGYEGTGYGGGGNSAALKYKPPGAGGINLSIPGFSGLTGAIGSILGGTPAQAAGLPKGAKAPGKAAQGAPQAQVTHKVTINGPLTASQKEFGKELVRLTGLHPKTVGGWLLAEDSYTAASSKESEGDANWLNIGPGYKLGSDPKKAAQYTANLINTSHYYSGIRASVGQGVGAQVAAIQASPWDGAHYPNGIPVNLVSGSGTGKVPKRVVTKFQAGVHAAAELDGRHLPYVWGGGHNSGAVNPGSGVDCSGAVSYVLQHMGDKLPGGVVSGDMGQYLRPGPGAVTVFYNAEHTFMRIGDKYFGTSTSNPGGGAGWFPASVGKSEVSEGNSAGSYNVGHVPGLGRKIALKMGIPVGSAGGATAFPGMTIANSGTTATINPGAGATQAKPGFSEKPIRASKLNRLRLVEQISAGNLQGLGIPGFTPQKGPDLASIGKAVEEARRKLLAA